MKAAISPELFTASNRRTILEAMQTIPAGSFVFGLSNNELSPVESAEGNNSD